MDIRNMKTEKETIAMLDKLISHSANARAQGLHEVVNSYYYEIERLQWILERPRNDPQVHGISEYLSEQRTCKL